MIYWQIFRYLLCLDSLLALVFLPLILSHIYLLFSNSGSPKLHHLSKPENTVSPHLYRAGLVVLLPMPNIQSWLWQRSKGHSHTKTVVVSFNLLFCLLDVQAREKVKSGGFLVWQEGWILIPPCDNLSSSFSSSWPASVFPLSFSLWAAPKITSLYIQSITS